MSTEDNFVKIRQYFTDEDWNGLSRAMKMQYANINENYKLMASMNLKPPLPAFMQPKPVPPTSPTKCTSHTPAGNQGKEIKDSQAPSAVAKDPSSGGITMFVARDCQPWAPLAIEPQAEAEGGGVSENGHQDETGTGAVGAEGRRCSKYTTEEVSCPDNGQDSGQFSSGQHSCRSSTKEPSSGSCCLPTRQEKHACVEYAEKAGKECPSQQSLDKSASIAMNDGNDETAPFTVFTCETCGDTFSSRCCFSARDLLEKHVQRMHQQKAEGKYCCAYCSYSSDIKASVTRHERSHTGERPFECHVCGKGFTLRHHLNDHQLVHSGERPHACIDCGRRFGRSPDLVRHRRLQHAVGVAVSHLCPQCGKRFSLRSNLKAHLLTHTGTKPHACSQCGRRFTKRSDALKHEATVHSH